MGIFGSRVVVNADDVKSPRARCGKQSKIPTGHKTEVMSFGAIHGASAGFISWLVRVFTTKQSTSSSQANQVDFASPMRRAEVARNHNVSEATKIEIRSLFASPTNLLVWGHLRAGLIIFANDSSARITNSVKYSRMESLGRKAHLSVTNVPRSQEFGSST